MKSSPKCTVLYISGKRAEKANKSIKVVSIQVKYSLQHQHIKTRAPHVGASAWLQLLLENSESKKGHNYFKKI